MVVVRFSWEPVGPSNGNLPLGGGGFPGRGTRGVEGTYTILAPFQAQWLNFVITCAEVGCLQLPPSFSHLFLQLL